MELDAKGRDKIRATKPPSLTMKVLRPLANLIAENTTPPQVDSILRDFGFSETSTTPSEACGALLRTFETLLEETNNKDITEIIETLLTLYAHLVPEEKHREQVFINSVAEILRDGHFNLGYRKTKKEYVVMPFKGPVHGIIMLGEGTTEEDFKDRERRKMRVNTISQADGLFTFTLTKDFKESLKTLNTLSQETQKSLTTFAKVVCSTLEIHGLSFPVKLLLNKDYELDEILKLTSLINYSILNPGHILFEEKDGFLVEIVTEIYGQKVVRNFSIYNNSYQASSKIYLNDVKELSKDNISNYVDKIIFSGNKTTLVKLQNFITQFDIQNKSKGVSEDQKSSTKLKINIDDEKGIYRLIDNQPVRYPHATCKSKIFMTIRYLMVHESANLAELSKHNKQERKSVKRGIKDFNKASRSRLSLPVDPITGDGIYKLNQDYIDFI